MISEGWNTWCSMIISRADINPKRLIGLAGIKGTLTTLKRRDPVLILIITVIAGVAFLALYHDVERKRSEHRD